MLLYGSVLIIGLAGSGKTIARYEQFHFCSDVLTSL